MEMEYKDPNRRGRFIVILGVVLASLAGGAAFYLINQAQNQAGKADAPDGQRSSWPPGDPRPQADRGRRRGGPRGTLDETNAQGVFSDRPRSSARVPSVADPSGQPVDANLLASGSRAAVRDPQSRREGHPD